ncbi:hypothetical protein BDW02DRAFT_467984, partial [Decorospora gaudefroyi]
PQAPSFSLIHDLRTARPAVRYTIYAGLALMATAETTFWFHVLRAKFFPSRSEEGKAREDELLGRVREAGRRVRGVWVGNYGRYFGADIWGVG